MAVDSYGNIFIADTGNRKVRMVNSRGIITTVAGSGMAGDSGDGGAATNAMFSYPDCVVVDNSGSLFITDDTSLRKVSRVSCLRSLVLDAVSIADAGNYFAVISNSSGSVTSSVAKLTVLDTYPPSFSQQPTNQTVFVGSSVNFGVTALGTQPVSYQWWFAATQQTNAVAAAITSYGFVVSANVSEGGTGYLAAPSVQFVGGSGSGASGYAIISNRMVTAIIMTNAGYGYTTPPTIQIAPPAPISLTGQTNGVLALAAVDAADAGNYFVLVTNNYGSVTSVVASLAVTFPPGYNQFSGKLLANGNMRLSFVGIPGRFYVMDRSYSLSPANWIPQVTNSTSSDGVLVFTNRPNAATNNFWRVRSVP